MNLYRYKLIGLSAFVFLLFNFGGISQEQPENEKPAKDELKAYIKYESATLIREKPLTMALEHVEAYLPDRTIKAEYFMGWRESEQTKDSEFPFDEIYGEGNIEITSGKDTIKADRFYYNLKKGQGIIKNIEWRLNWTDEDGNIPDGVVPMVIRADEVIQTKEDTFKAYGASVTTCPHGKPHYDLFAGIIVLTKNAENKSVSFYNIVPRIQGFPIFYIPYYYKVIGDDPIIRSLRTENSSRFGFTTKVVAGININKYKRDSNGKPVKNKDGDYIKKRWGDLTLGSDVYRKRGIGWEPELKYRWEKYYGSINGYYIKDKGPDPNNAYDRQFLPMEKEERGRLKAFNRYNDFLISGLRFDTEYHYISDRHFLLEYFEKEARQDKEPESYGYWRLMRNNKAATLLEKARTNDFQNQTEYLPQLTGKIMKEPLIPALPLYFSSMTEASNLRKRFDDDLHIPDIPRLARFDTFNELTSPIKISFISLTPHISGRFTTYEKEILSETYTDRFIGSTGINLFTQFSRKYYSTNSSLGINQIRHLISLDTRYNKNIALTRNPEELIQYDNTDKLDRFTEYYIEIRNRFQTKHDGVFFEFLNVGVSAEYYPDASRDTTKENINNYIYPMNWITLAPLTLNMLSPDFPKRRLSNINLDASFTPKNIFSVALSNEYNTYEDHGEVFNAVSNIMPYPGWNIGISERYVRELSNTAGLSLSCSPIEKWWLTVSEQFDFISNRFSTTAWTLRRDLHELFLEFAIIVDRTRDEKSFNFSIAPKGIFDKGLSIK